MTPKPAVLISIRPKWCELIATNQKTLEVRKSRPAIEPPFTCYIYCTHGQRENVPLAQFKTWRGRIIGEFACGKISAYPMLESLDDAKACRDFWAKALLKTSAIREYSSGNKTLYGWHISGLCVYKNPLDLSALSGIDGEPLKRAPQSWRYVMQNF